MHPRQSSRVEVSILLTIPLSGVTSRDLNAYLEVRPRREKQKRILNNGRTTYNETNYTKTENGNNTGERGGRGGLSQLHAHYSG